jgi:hypothetical protein
VKVVGVPVVTCPSTAEVGIVAAGGPANVRAAELEKYASITTLARPEPRTQVVVIATGALPAATPPETRAKLTALGVAEIVRDSPSVAVRETLAVLEFSA